MRVYPFMDPGESISQEHTILSLQGLQLSLYRIMVRNSGDGPFVTTPTFKRDFQHLSTTIEPTPGASMTISHRFYLGY